MTSGTLVDVLIPSAAPCFHFKGSCHGKCKWDPDNGFIPRGFGGGRDPKLIKLILITSEPGNPADGEQYTGSASQMIEAHVAFFEQLMMSDSLRREGRAAPFHRNLRRILDLCWPDLELEDQLQATWFTNAVLCSAEISGGKIPREVETACISTYLQKELVH
jgi:hypothetical protein